MPAHADNTPKPVYALVGSDSFLQLMRLREVLDLMPADVQRTDLDGERAELAAVLDECRSFAMFGGARLVVVRNADDFISRFREQLEEYCSAPSDSATLVLRCDSLPKNVRLYKAIQKTGAVLECEAPPAGALPKWISDRAKSTHRVQIAPDAAMQLAELIGPDLGRLDTELAKLALSSDGKLIQLRDVGEAVVFQREQKMWEMTNALAAGDTAEALRRWRHLLAADPSTEFRAVTWLGMWLETVRKALALKRSGVNPGQIATQLRIFPREIQQPFMRTADRLGDAGAARALDLLALVDRQSKSGVGEAASNVERFMLELAL
jgi:DNA polymerase-3 subunit delta